MKTNIAELRSCGAQH